MASSKDFPKSSIQGKEDSKKKSDLRGKNVTKDGQNREFQDKNIIKDGKSIHLQNKDVTKGVENLDLGHKNDFTLSYLKIPTVPDKKKRDIGIMKPNVYNGFLPDVTDPAKIVSSTSVNHDLHLQLQSSSAPIISSISAKNCSSTAPHAITGTARIYSSTAGKVPPTVADSIKVEQKTRKGYHCTVCPVVAGSAKAGTSTAGRVPSAVVGQGKVRPLTKGIIPPAVAFPAKTRPSTAGKVPSAVAGPVKVHPSTAGKMPPAVVGQAKASPLTAGKFPPNVAGPAKAHSLTAGKVPPSVAFLTKDHPSTAGKVPPAVAGPAKPQPSTARRYDDEHLIPPNLDDIVTQVQIDILKEYGAYPGPPEAYIGNSCDSLF